MNSSIITSHRLQRQGYQGYSDNLRAWITAVESGGNIVPSDIILKALDTFLATSLESGTIFSRMKTGNILHAGSKGAAKMNLKNPSTYQLTEVGMVTWSEGNGVKSASNSYFNQPFKTNEYAGIETDITFVSYVSESSTLANNNSPYGFRINSAGSAFAMLRPLVTATTFGVYQYGGGLSPANSSTNHKGLYISTRLGGVAVTYKDGNKYSSSIAASSPDISINRLILAINNASTNNGVTPVTYYTNYVGVDFIFDSAFSDTDAARFKTAFDTYKTAVGLP